MLELLKTETIARALDRSLRKRKIAKGLGVLLSVLFLALPLAAATNAVKNVSTFASFRNRTWVTGEGCVTRVLPDDLIPPCHQRFEISDAAGKTMLVVNSIEGWPRLAGVGVGDRVAFRGEFIDAENGPLVHWTHPDKSRRRKGGWVKIVAKAPSAPEPIEQFVATQETLPSLEAKEPQLPAGRKEYFAGNGPIRQRKAAPVNEDWPETGYWLSTNSDARHNKRCENYRKTRGYPCKKTDGRPCGKCGG